jgi:hypothetical protein
LLVLVLETNCKDDDDENDSAPLKKVLAFATD